MKIQTDRPPTARSAFTLLEVMFAMVAFCTAIFVILALVANSLAGARRLQRPMVDAGVLAAQLSQTNQLVEGVKSGSLDELLGNSYQGYTWTRDIEEVQTNKLFQVDFIVQSDSGEKPVVSKMSILLFRPQFAGGQPRWGHGGQMKVTSDMRQVAGREEDGRIARAAIMSRVTCHASPACFHAARTHAGHRDFQSRDGGDLFVLDAHPAGHEGGPGGHGPGPAPARRRADD